MKGRAGEAMGVLFFVVLVSGKNIFSHYFFLMVNTVMDFIDLSYVDGRCLLSFSFIKKKIIIPPTPTADFG